MRWLIVCILLLPGCAQEPANMCGGGEFTGNAPPMGVFSWPATDVAAHLNQFGYNFTAITIEGEQFFEDDNGVRRVLIRHSIRGIEIQMESEYDYPPAGVNETSDLVSTWFERMQVGELEPQWTFTDNAKRRGWYQSWNDTILASTAGLLVSQPNGTASLQFGALRALPDVFATIDVEDASTSFIACSDTWSGTGTPTGLTVVNDSISFEVLALDATCDAYRHFFVDALTGAVASEVIPCASTGERVT